MSASSHKVYFLIQVVAARIKKKADELLMANVGISTAQAAVLMLLSKDEAITQRELATRLMQQESAITTMISRLQAADLVSKRRSRADARAWEVRITNKGAHAVRQASEIFTEVNKLLDDALKEEDMDHLAGSLTRVLASFD